MGQLAARPEDQPPRTRWTVLGPLAALVALAGLLALRAIDIDPVARLRLVGFDTMQRILGTDDTAQQSVTVLAIDEASLDAYGQWPWPRDVMASVVTAADAGGARLIAFDVVFAEPDRLNPDALVGRLGLPPAEAEALLGAALAPDEALARAIAASAAPVVLANALQGIGRARPEAANVMLPPTIAFDGAPADTPLTAAEWVVGNIPALEAVADGRGFLTIFNDGDGVVRRLPMLAHAGSSLQTGLALEVTRIALGADKAAIRSNSRFGVSSLTVGDRTLATDEAGAVWLPLPGTPVARISIADLLAGRAAPEALGGRIVLIGSTALGLGDLVTTAAGTTWPGVELLAYGIAAMLDGTLPSRPGYAGWLEMFAALVIGLVFIYRMSLYSAVRTAVWGVVSVIAILAAGLAALAIGDTLIDPTFPGVVAALFAAGAGYTRSRQIEYGRQLARQRLAEADRLIGRLVDATFDAIVIVDREGRLLFANRAAAALPILSGGLAAGADLRPVLRPADSRGSAARASLFEELAARHGIVDLVTTSTDGGVPVYLEVTATALDEDGATALVMRDVTARRAARRRIEAQAAELTQLTEDLQRQSDEAQAARAAAESANAAKGEFLMMMSHELRTPLNAVIGFTELMSGEPYGPIGDQRYHGYLGDIRTSGIRLLAMIDMILEVIRLDSQDVAAHDAAFAVDAIVAECCGAMQSEADGKAIRLESYAAGGLPRFLGDARLMRQVVVCLLSNAIKFTDAEGHVGVSVDRAADGGLAFSVTDNGVGMTRAELERAEVLLQQGGGGMVRRHGGVGVGLTLAKLATEKQGGRIELESTVGRGTVVRVVFPATRLDEPAAAPAAQDPVLT